MSSVTTKQEKRQKAIETGVLEGLALAQKGGRRTIPAGGVLVQSAIVYALLDISDELGQIRALLEKGAR